MGLDFALAGALARDIIPLIFMLVLVYLMPLGSSVIAGQIAEAQAELEKAKANLKQLEEKPEVKAALEQFEKDATKFTDEQARLYSVHNSMAMKVDTLEGKLASLQGAQTNVAIITTDKSGVPKLRGAEETWLKDGKVWQGNRDQWKRVEQHHNIYHKLKAALASSTADMEDVESIIQEGIDTCDAQARKVLVGHKEGWKVVTQMETPEYLYTEEEIKEVQTAKRQAQLADKLEKSSKRSGKKPRGGYRPQFPRGGYQQQGYQSPGSTYGGFQFPTPFMHVPQFMPGYGPGQGSGAKGPRCFLCNEPGHLAKDCTRKG
jgi:hypothetical protein